MTPLYASLLKNPTGVDQLVQDWFDNLNNDGPGTVATALSTITDVASAPNTQHEHLISTEMVIANNPHDAVTAVCAAAGLEALDKRSFTKIRKSYVHFWYALVQECPDPVLFETDLVDTIITWLQEMTRAPPKALRLVASIAAFAFVDGLIDRIILLRATLANFQKQLATEHTKMASPFHPRRSRPTPADDEQSGRSSSESNGSAAASCASSEKVHQPDIAHMTPKAQSLVENISELSGCDEELLHAIERCVSSIALVKYRDVFPDVRIATVQAMGKWALRLPTHFMNDEHSKYMAWLLYDRDAAVRRAALQSVIPLLKLCTDTTPPAEFLRRVQHRVVEMLADKDPDIRSVASKACASLIRSGVSLNADFDLISLLCASDNNHIHQAVGDLIAAITEKARAPAKSSQVASPVSSTRTAGVPSDSSPPSAAVSITPASGTTGTQARKRSIAQFKEDIRHLLLSVLDRTGGDAPTAAKLVDALWSHMPALQCWNAYGELFADYTGHTRKHASKSQKEISESNVIALSAMFLSAAKRVADTSRTDQPPGHSKSRGKAKKQPTADSKREINELTSYLIPLLPTLLTQFRGVPNVLAHLVQLPAYMELSVYTLEAREGFFDSLLNELGDVMKRHATSEIVQLAASTIAKLSTNDNPLANAATVALRKACSDAAKTIRSVVRSGFTAAGKENVEAAVFRAAVLGEIYRLPDSAQTDTGVILRALRSQVMPKSWEVTVGIWACRLQANIWVWSTHQLLTDITESLSITDGLCHAIVEKRIQKYLELVSLLQDLACDNKKDLIFRSAMLKVYCAMLSLESTVERKIKSFSSATSKQIAAESQTLLEMYIESNALSLDNSMADTLVQCMVAFAANCHENNENEKELCELMACAGRLLNSGLLPTHLAHLPLLGLATDKAGDHVGAFDMSKLYHQKLSGSISEDNLLKIELLTLPLVRSINELNVRSTIPSIRNFGLCFRTLKRKPMALGELIRLAMSVDTSLDESDWRHCLEKYVLPGEKKPSGGRKRKRTEEVDDDNSKSFERVSKQNQAVSPVDITNVRRSARKQVKSVNYVESDLDADEELASLDGDNEDLESSEQGPSQNDINGLRISSGPSSSSYRKRNSSVLKESDSSRTKTARVSLSKTRCTPSWDESEGEESVNGQDESFADVEFEEELADRTANGFVGIDVTKKTNSSTSVRITQGKGTRSTKKSRGSSSKIQRERGTGPRTAEHGWDVVEEEDDGLPAMDVIEESAIHCNVEAAEVQGGKRRPSSGSTRTTRSTRPTNLTKTTRTNTKRPAKKTKGSRGTDSTRDSEAMQNATMPKVRRSKSSRRW